VIAAAMTRFLCAANHPLTLIPFARRETPRVVGLAAIPETWVVQRSIGE
jgi:hypothetical protein